MQKSLICSFFHANSENDIIFLIRSRFWLTEPNLAWAFFSGLFFSGVARLQDGRPAAVFYSFGYLLVRGVGYLKGKKTAAGCSPCGRAPPETAAMPFGGWPAGRAEKGGAWRARVKL